MTNAKSGVKLLTVFLMCGGIYEKTYYRRSDFNCSRFNLYRQGKQSAYGKAEAKAAMSQKFIEMDSNGDGLVSKEEFDAAAQKEIADKKVDTPEKLEKFNKFMAYTWENGDVNHDNYLSPEEFAAQRQRNREKFSRKK